MKKIFVLVVLFVLPIVAYLFFASGVTNFGRLPVLTQKVDAIPLNDSSVTFNDKITVLGFLGKVVALKKGNAFNLNEKIYKRFQDFDDFQFIMVVPEGTEEAVEGLKKELGTLSTIDKWHFVFLPENRIPDLFKSLGTDLALDENLSTSYVFLIDKDRGLRGRTDDEDEGTKYGFDTNSVADLHNKMIDDVKIILAEYRLALKRNNSKLKTKV
jgi:hypothetical protein